MPWYLKCAENLKFENSGSRNFGISKNSGIRRVKFTWLSFIRTVFNTFNKFSREFRGKRKKCVKNFR